MSKLFYRPENAWVGDLIPYYENELFYGFYLHDPRIKDKEYAEETTWHLITTKDFVKTNYKGEAIARGANDKPNKNAYTGSVLKDKNGLYHAFYTAYNADIKIDGKSIQSVMKATGTNLEELKTVDDFLFVADSEIYEEFDWRDPFVFFNEKEDCYYMLLAARMKNSGNLRGGCIALCKSKDLVTWTYEKPFYDPKMYVTMECPEVFKLGDYWYLVFSTFSDQFTTHYRIAKDINGPWKIPDDDVFDTRADYAIKTAGDEQKRYLFGWIASKYGSNDFSDWEWGGTMVFHELVQNGENGELHVKPIEGVKNYYSNVEEHKEKTFYNCSLNEKSKEMKISSETLGAVLFDIPKDCFSLEMEFEVEKAHEFGIALHTDEGMEKGYFLRMNQIKNEVAWDMWPRSTQGKYQWQIKGDVPYQIETKRVLPKGNKYSVLIIREDDICVVYINDEVVLSTRMYNHKCGKAGLYVIDGQAELKDYKIKK